MSFGVSGGGDYAFVRNPAAQKGTVFTMGAALGLDFYPGVDDLIASVTVPDDSLVIVLHVYLAPRLLFFVNERLAPFIGLTPRLSYILSEKDDTGTRVSLTSQESFYLKVRLTFGISWFIPSKKASLLLND